MVELDGIESGHLARLPQLTSLERLVLRIVRSLGILCFDPDARVPDLAMLKVSLDGATTGAHTVSVQCSTGRTYVNSFNYPDQLVADTMLISINAEGLAEEMFGERQVGTNHQHLPVRSTQSHRRA